LYQIQVNKEKINRRSADELFEFLIAEPLNQSAKIPESKRLCIIIDALDEAGRNNGTNSLAELLAKHASKLPEWLGLIVTSRPEPYLKQTLKSLSIASLQWKNQENLTDLSHWINQRISEDVQGKDRQKIIDKVIEKSGGAFLYLSLLDKDTTLDINTPEKLPQKLDGFFRQNFTRYFPDPVEYRKKVEPSLRLIIAAPGPMPAKMLQNILGYQKCDQVINFLEPMGSLLRESGDGLVLFHAALTDWLKDSTRSGVYCVNETGFSILGEYIWKEFEISEESIFEHQILNWLAELLPYTTHWDNVSNLMKAAKYLDENKRFMPSRTLLKQILKLPNNIIFLN
jgi:hypothetical protein